MLISTATITTRLIKKCRHASLAGGRSREVRITTTAMSATTITDAVAAR
jgi:hypothetical protein